MYSSITEIADQFETLGFPDIKEVLSPAIAETGISEGDYVSFFNQEIEETEDMPFTNALIDNAFVLITQKALEDTVAVFDPTVYPSEYVHIGEPAKVKLRASPAYAQTSVYYPKFRKAIETVQQLAGELYVPSDDQEATASDSGESTEETTA